MAAQEQEEAVKGRFYEDFKMGDVYKHQNGRTVTDNDNIWFTLMTNNTNQIHFNKDYCEKNFPGEPFNGKMVVNAGLTFGIVGGLTVEDTSKYGAMLGMNNMKIPNPVFAGDTLYAESTVIGRRESKSRPDMGIITIKTRGYNQKGVTVMEFERTFLIRKKGTVWK